MARILTISGSLRTGSYNASLLRALEDQLPAGHDVVRYDGALLGAVPAFNEDEEAARAGEPAVVQLREAIANADVVVIATPEYNGSVPGHLKNALDWVSRPSDVNPMRGTRVAVLSASTGQFGGVWAGNDLRRILGVLGARTLKREVAVPLVDSILGADGSVANPGTIRQLVELAADIHEAALEAAPVSTVG